MNVKAHRKGAAEVTDKTDEALMKAYQHGDESALETLVRRHADNLLGYLIRMTKNREQAEDLFQETFIRVHTKARTFRASGRFKPWLFQIATNLALDMMRKTKRRPSTVSLEQAHHDALALKEVIPAKNANPAEAMSKADMENAVRVAVDCLPPRQHTTLVLAYYEGLPYREVAELMGCSVGTVKTQMSRALQLLAKLLPSPRAEGGAV